MQIEAPTPEAGVDAGGESEISQPEDAVDESELPSGIYGEGEEAVIRAFGKCPKGRDVSLARQVAANRARSNLLKLAREKGYSVEPPGILREAVIERFFYKGRFVYAVGALPLSKVTGSLNQNQNPPSNNPEDNQKGKN